MFYGLFCIVKFENVDFQGKIAYHSPNNYRIFVFSNRKMFIQVDDAEYDISHKRWFYDENWAFQYFNYNMPVLNDARHTKAI